MRDADGTPRRDPRDPCERHGPQDPCDPQDPGRWQGRAGWTATERRLLAVLRGCGDEPRVAAAARALSHSGEHAALWLAAGLVCAAADRERRDGWLRGTALIAAAHLASMGVKRVVRRPRPLPVTGEPLVRTAGRHSFPSSHATSAVAAAVAFGVLRPAGRVVAPPVAAAMCVSRLVAGVHYPSDVAAGALLGGLLARGGAAWLRAGGGSGTGGGRRV
ncbi:phosphatase PAP2 family protein [Streptomyces chengbuensis]|uniref:phosphatase PAP2 family protein n=1 Tax=Streptomyces TaxID=1883 RepID=UPI0025B56696|nr:phosphatase PAP2 family protein [Streptomyces sp. HUAS CB01]WJY52123.1 phosphatase PAP2 family protein [Streptomyces sp. HUAS CB01]